VQSGLNRFPGATVACWQHRPTSAGHVRATSSDPFTLPEIHCNYLGEEEDRRVLLAAMRLSRSVLHSAPFKPLVAGEIWPGADRQSDADLLDHARRTGNTAYHPMGTCRMGPAEREDSVVDDAYACTAFKASAWQMPPSCR
jgi:choline dehydrogenase